MKNKKAISKSIEDIHGKDEEQLDFIFSQKQRIIVTAPAGYGKTKTMISKIAYKIVTDPTIHHKKILALTFSVNAANKIKKDTNELLPELLDDENVDLSKKLDVANYHNLARILLKKHGYLLNKNLGAMDSFRIVSDYSAVLKDYLSSSEMDILSEYDKCIKNFNGFEKENIDNVEKLESNYFEILNEILIPNEVITFNGLLLFSYYLLNKKSIRNFYQQYYKMIIVDEFQDTNYLSYRLLTKLMGENEIILMGDKIQKIYGFIGAIPDLFDHMAEEFNMEEMRFKTNHRFDDNEKMKKLDSYIRSIFLNYSEMDSFDKEAEMNFKFFKSNHKEAEFIVEHIKDKISDSDDVSILCRASYCTNEVIEKLEEQSISYFNGLFNDTDREYVAFHEKALDVFLEESGINQSIAKRVLSRVVDRMEELLTEDIYEDDTMYIYNSLLRLLKKLFQKTKAENISKNKKFEKISFVLENESLKHLMNEIDERITITTIHGAKGLEWDYVYIPRVTAYSFPTSKGLCKLCSAKQGKEEFDKCCKFQFLSSLREEFEEVLSIFYVGITRAKKDVFLFANMGLNRYGYHKKASCLIALPNLNYNQNF
ncbi:UvrD-helicase domain-containing protein [Halanaerobacter jeridensis]|uniref:DNA 3'-5' helicase n=1 Tax=Halanaerobacter jeridensis TaxID=706427 RepID=A0A938XW17_9FIRM|nr:ATP-dependent helicase [Halanaerobacter jeridensis]MBM7556305.1 DNA helicase-2/ATP-dependent DNA helicase PcrA [Halanaerobacter jeridensis]